MIKKKKTFLSESEKIIKYIVTAVNFTKKKKNHRSNDSYYYYVKCIDSDDEYICVRISNHRTKCQTWVSENKMLKYAIKVRNRISIVFEGEKTENDVYLYNKVKKPIVVDEYVFDTSNRNLDYCEIVDKIINIEKFGIFECETCEYNVVKGIQMDKRCEGVYHNIPRCKRLKR